MAKKPAITKVSYRIQHDGEMMEFDSLGAAQEKRNTLRLEKIEVDILKRWVDNRGHIRFVKVEE